jgi:3-methylcrotonyl-CoA carboxylase beta subunit
MGGEQAAGVLATVQRESKEKEGLAWTEEEENLFKQPILDKFERESHSFYSSARLWDDGIILPEDTRKVLGLAFSYSMKNAPFPKTSFGVFRM